MERDHSTNATDLIELGSVCGDTKGGPGDHWEGVGFELHGAFRRLIPAPGGGCGQTRRRPARRLRAPARLPRRPQNNLNISRL